MRELQPGAVMNNLTDVRASVDSDNRAWCGTTGHELVEVREAAGAREYAVRKAADVREQPGWAIVISNPVSRSCFLRWGSQLRQVYRMAILWLPG